MKRENFMTIQNLSYENYRLLYIRITLQSEVYKWIVYNITLLSPTYLLFNICIMWIRIFCWMVWNIYMTVYSKYRVVALVVGHTLVIGHFRCKSCTKIKFVKLINSRGYLLGDSHLKVQNC